MITRARNGLNWEIVGCLRAPIGMNEHRLRETLAYMLQAAPEKKPTRGHPSDRPLGRAYDKAVKQCGWTHARLVRRAAAPFKGLQAVGHRFSKSSAMSSTSLIPPSTGRVARRWEKPDPGAAAYPPDPASWPRPSRRHHPMITFSMAMQPCFGVGYQLSNPRQMWRPLMRRTLERSGPCLISCRQKCCRDYVGLEEPTLTEG
jgi:hypothetical protein